MTSFILIRDRKKTGPTPKQDRSKRHYASRDKRLNTNRFNRMANNRRAIAKKNAVNRKKNRKCGFGG